MSDHEARIKAGDELEGTPNDASNEDMGLGTPGSDEEEEGDSGGVSREHKDRLFKLIFGRAENKRWTLALYNAVAGRAYDDPDLLEFNTIGDAVYVGMRNDVSFIIAAEMVLWEHQSTWNPNMPMRFLLYGARLFQAYITLPKNGYNIYSESLQKLPRPRCVCFYNGVKDAPDRQVLRLSDAFETYAGGEELPGDFEVCVTMLNVNYGHNAELMAACAPLREYSWFVDAVRRHQAECGDLEKAVDEALREMPDDFSIKEYLVRNRAEVKSVIITEWDQEMMLRMVADENKRIGRLENSRETAARMLKMGESVEKVAVFCALSEEEVRSIEESILAPV